MATLNFLYRSTKENECLNVRLLFRYNDVDYTQGAKTKLLIYSYDELVENPKLSGKHYWKKLHGKTKAKDIDLLNKQTEINSKLNEITNYILKAFQLTGGETVSNDASWLKDTLEMYYNPPKAVSTLPTKLVTFFDYYIDKRGAEMTEHRIRNIKVTKHKLEKLESKLRRKINVADVNENFKNDFVDYCTLNSYAPNTQQRELSLIKTVCRYARYLGLETHPQMDTLKIAGSITHSVYLNENEIDAIRDVELELDYLDNARDWLLISCNVGQRVSDFMRFSPKMIRIEEGKHLLEFKQKKTKKLMTIPLSKEVREILKKHDGNFPRATSSQKYNNYIKEVCRLAGINEMVDGKRRICIAPEGVKPTKNHYRDVKGKFEKWELVSSHIGRRSFATNYYGRVPTTFLINITGHSSEKMFLNYIKKSNKDLAIESYDYFN